MEMGMKASQRKTLKIKEEFCCPDGSPHYWDLDKFNHGICRKCGAERDHIERWRGGKFSNSPNINFDYITKDILRRTR